MTSDEQLVKINACTQQHSSVQEKYAKSNMKTGMKDPICSTTQLQCQQSKQGSQMYNCNYKRMQLQATSMQQVQVTQAMYRDTNNYRGTIMKQWTGTRLQLKLHVQIELGRDNLGYTSVRIK